MLTGVPAGGDTSKGAVFVYDLATLDLKRVIQPPDVTSHDAFGSRIALDGNHAAISAYQYLPYTSHSGAVYVIDWSDLQHCHNPRDELWDRTNGRIYRISWAQLAFFGHRANGVGVLVFLCFVPTSLLTAGRGGRW